MHLHDATFFSNSSDKGPPRTALVNDTPVARLRAASGCLCLRSHLQGASYRDYFSAEGPAGWPVAIEASTRGMRLRACALVQRNETKDGYQHDHTQSKQQTDPQRPTAPHRLGSANALSERADRPRGSNLQAADRSGELHP